MQLLWTLIPIGMLLWHVQIVPWNDRYIEKGTSATINGLFIWLVFLSHFAQYAPDVMSNQIGRLLGQLVVVMFLFYSGYGCMAQYKIKGTAYLEGFPAKRILPTIVNFDIAVIIYLIMWMVLGKIFSWKQIALSLVCWDSVGNGNWYIFVILMCYGCFWLVSLIKGYCTSRHVCGVLMLILLIGFGIVLSRVKQEWWYDTVTVFAAGMLYSEYKDKIEPFVRSNYWTVLAAFVFIFCTSSLIKHPHIIMYNLKGIGFAAIIVMCTMKISFTSPMLRWCGDRLFPIYLYHRIPMIYTLERFPSLYEGVVGVLLSLVISAVFTICIAGVYRHLRFDYSHR